MDTKVEGPDSANAIHPFSERVSRILNGAIDMHCHSGPSMMPRSLDHIEAMHDAEANGLRAVLIKDHYYSVTPITELLKKHFSHLHVRLFSGVPLNNASGGFNVYAVEHGLNLGAKIVWMPTFSSNNHIEHEKRSKQFPHTRKKMIDPIPLTVLSAPGKIRDEVKPILDLIAEHDVILSGGHLHISEILPLFEEAKRHGVKRLLCNHPSYLIDATLDDIRHMKSMGAYIEHSLCMFIEAGGLPKLFEPAELKELIDAGSIENTILGSDLGQMGNMWPVRGFRSVICECLTMGYTDAQIRTMICDNPAKLLGLDEKKPAAPAAAPH